MKHDMKQDQVQFSQELRQELRETNQQNHEANQWNHEDTQKNMIATMQNLWGNMRQEVAAHIPPTLVHPSTSERSRDFSTLTQNTYETRNMTAEIQAKRQAGKAPKTPTSNKMPITEETIDYAPGEETIDYVMNDIPHSYGEFLEFQDDPDVDDPQL